MTDRAVSLDSRRWLVLGESGLAGMDQTLDDLILFHELMETPFSCEPGIGERCFDSENYANDIVSWRCQEGLNFLDLALDRFAFETNDRLPRSLATLENELIDSDSPSQISGDPVIY